MTCFFGNIPSLFSVLQSPIQAYLRPAMWIPGLNTLHSHREQWVTLRGTADELVEELVQAVNKIKRADGKTYWHVQQVDREKRKVQIYNWTRAEWLDVVEIEFRDGANGGVEAKCYSFSSGFLPTCIPLCFVFNIFLFFAPFLDLGLNSRRLERLRNSMESRCDLQKSK